MTTASQALTVVLDRAKGHLHSMRELQPVHCPDPKFSGAVQESMRLMLELQIASIEEDRKVGSKAAAIGGGVGAAAAGIVTALGNGLGWW